MRRVRSAHLGDGLAPLCVVALALSGCYNDPARIEAPDWDPSGLADRIISELDTDADGHVSDEEWLAAPGLAAGAESIDENSDGQLSREELVERFEIYEQSRVGLMPATFRIVYKGRPLAGAEVRFVPEPFLEGIVEPARGTANRRGMVSPRTEIEDLPAMQVGFYRVEVTSSDVLIPEKYNTATTLGVFVSPLAADQYASFTSAQLELSD